MRYDGTNLNEVLAAHLRWLDEQTNDEDRADFSEMTLGGVDLRGALLFGADFHGANLFGACLVNANLSRADLTGTSFKGAILHNTYMRGAVGDPQIPIACPDTGSFIAWKRCVRITADMTSDSMHGWKNSVIVKLLIPEDARRTSNQMGECRADKAVVLEMQSLDGEVLPDKAALSIYDKSTPYVVGETVYAKGYTGERFTQWTPGIYFYITRQEAVDYLTLGRYDGQQIELDVKWMENAMEESNHWDGRNGVILRVGGS